jgi:predicted DNA repair protein MutK
MAGASLLALLDDIATVLDDVAVLTKVAAKKTTGVLGDDLALNAQQVAGVRAERELPVVWAVAKGSLLNKAILVPAALAISAFAPWLIAPLLMLGGTYLCFEGVEKVWHKLLAHRHEKEADDEALTRALLQPEVDLVQFEADKIKGAIRTDFILSAEIIVISLGAVAGKTFGVQFGVLTLIALVMTIGVYGLVAGIVKMDDAGLWLTRRHAAGPLHQFGRGLLALAPPLMKLLGVVGTLAMFLVGGGILVHEWHALHQLGPAVGRRLVGGARRLAGRRRGSGRAGAVGVGRTAENPATLSLVVAGKPTTARNSSFHESVTLLSIRAIAGWGEPG